MVRHGDIAYSTFNKTDTQDLGQIGTRANAEVYVERYRLVQTHSLRQMPDRCTPGLHRRAIQWTTCHAALQLASAGYTHYRPGSTRPAWPAWWTTSSGQVTWSWIVSGRHLSPTIFKHFATAAKRGKLAGGGIDHHRIDTGYTDCRCSRIIKL